MQNEHEIANVALVELDVSFVLGSFDIPSVRIHFGKFGALGFHVSSSGAPFWNMETTKGSILRILGSLWASFLVTFEGPEAPGHAPGGSLCSKGALDRFWERFWEPNGRPREPKCFPKSI